MTEDTPKRSDESLSADLSQPFERQTSLLEWFYTQSQAGRWRVPRERFAAVLERSARKALTPGDVSTQRLHDYLGALHSKDLALATACAEGGEDAWEYFFTPYRPTCAQPR